MDIIKGLGTAADVLRKADKIPEYQQILDAMRQLTDQETEIAQLKRENRELKEAAEIKKNLIHRGEVYYLVEEGGEQGPFCALCYDTKEKLIRMTYWNDHAKKCQNCEKIYAIK